MPEAPTETEGTPAAFHLGHRRWLDGVRGTAILLVVLFHLRILVGGFLGVDVFFVLSGFLITCVLAGEHDRRGSIRFGRFYLRRALRLLPAFLTYVAVCYLYVRATDPEEVGTYLRGALVAVLYLANWPALHQTDMPLLGHTWSLAVEEQFYLLWPVLLWGMLRLGSARRTILIVVGVGIVAAAVHRAVLFEMRPPPGPERAMHIARLYEGLDTRADALLAGCLVGLATTWGRLPRSERAIVQLKIASRLSYVGLAFMFWRAGMDHHNMYYGLYAATAVMVAIVLVRQLVAPARWLTLVLESAPLVGLGRISYALYLYHVLVIGALGAERFGRSAPMEALLAGSLSVAAAVASYYLVERPFLRLKGRVAAAEPRGAEAPPPR